MPVFSCNLGEDNEYYLVKSFQKAANIDIFAP